jgi:hypothetical protein
MRYTLVYHITHDLIAWTNVSPNVLCAIATVAIILDAKRKQKTEEISQSRHESLAEITSNRTLFDMTLDLTYFQFGIQFAQPVSL